MTHVSKLEQLTSMHQFQIVLLQMLQVDVVTTPLLTPMIR